MSSAFGSFVDFELYDCCSFVDFALLPAAFERKVTCGVRFSCLGR